ncbi:MAG: hypothetical protein ACTSWF_00005, partial [Candidatus Freyarchaeota archaeon]
MSDILTLHLPETIRGWRLGRGELARVLARSALLAILFERWVWGGEWGLFVAFWRCFALVPWRFSWVVCEVP